MGSTAVVWDRPACQMKRERRWLLTCSFFMHSSPMRSNGRENNPRQSQLRLATDIWMRTSLA